MSSSQEATILARLSGIEALAKAPGNYGKSGHHVSFMLEAGQLRPAARAMFDQEYFLESICALDAAEGILLLYHFDRYDRSERVVFRLLVSHEQKTAPSIVSIYSGADWHERECFDFHGVIFEGHPALKPLILPDDLGTHPLLKQTGRQSTYKLLPLDQLTDTKS